jgi:chemotaxis protein methyltransferase CheR
LQESLLSLKDWRITLLATDINDRFLRKARAAVYGEWSFRGLPPEFKQRHFTRAKDGRFTLLPHIRDRVSFAPLNLVEDCFPSLATGAHAMDVIFCRNVLMYFTPEQAREVVGKLHRTLVDGGWLIVSQSEGSQQLFSSFRQATIAGAILYEKTSAAQGAQTPGCSVATSPVQSTADTPVAVPLPTAASVPAQQIATSHLQMTQALAVQAREHANQGRLEQALSCCDRWIATDALDPASRYLRAVILQEMGDPVRARQSLQHALYLQPDFVLAHFGLGNLARSRGSVAESNRHFANALALLRSYLPEDSLPQSDGLTAGRLEEILTSLIALELAG